MSCRIIPSDPVIWLLVASGQYIKPGVIGRIHRWQLLLVCALFGCIVRCGIALAAIRSRGIYRPQFSLVNYLAQLIALWEYSLNAIRKTSILRINIRTLPLTSGRASLHEPRALHFTLR